MNPLNSIEAISISFLEVSFFERSFFDVLFDDTRFSETSSKILSKFLMFWAFSKEKTILSIDMGINTDATCTVMKTDGTIFARKFIEGKIDLLRIFFLSYKNIKNYTFNFVLLEQN